jgi:hypothetical protein
MVAGTSLHGWMLLGKCTFDISLDYIKYIRIAPVCFVTVWKMMEQTGENGFHYVDEAAPAL